MGGTSEGERSSGCRMHRRRGGTVGCMVSGSNEHHSQPHSKEDQDLHQIEAVVEHRHQREKKSGQKGQMKTTEFSGSHPGRGRAPEVNLAVQ